MIKLFDPGWVVKINVMGTWMNVKRGTYEEFEANNQPFVRFQTLTLEFAIVSDPSIVGWVYTLPEAEMETLDEIKQP